MTMPYQIPKDGIPHGGARGTSFDDFAWLGGPEDAYVYSVQVNHGQTLDHLTVTYMQGGQPRVKQHGASPGGTPYDPWVIDRSKNERLAKVEIWLHAYSGDTLELNGIQFTKSIWSGGTLTYKPSPLFGSTEGGYAPFTLKVPDAPQPKTHRHPDDSIPSEICAFWGKEGDFVDALGIWVREGA
jgi:hypothetical protein